MGKRKANTAFGKDARVSVKNTEHPYHLMVGTVTNGNLTQDGLHPVLFDDDTIGLLMIHADDLDLVRDEQEAAASPVNEFSYASYLKEEMAEFNAELLKDDPKQYIIMEGTLKDDYCNFSFKITDGVGAGNVCIVKDTKHIILPDMKKAFEHFHVHLAVIDDVFKHAGIEILDVDTLHNHELTMLYHVTGFKIAGNEEGETIVLKGSKYTSRGDRLELTSPKIGLDNLSSYQWYNELKTAADEARKEVALYKEGKYTVDEEDDEEDLDENGDPKPKRKKKSNVRQLTIGDAIAEAQQSKEEEEEDLGDKDDDFGFSDLDATLEQDFTDAKV